MPFIEPVESFSLLFWIYDILERIWNKLTKKKPRKPPAELMELLKKKGFHFSKEDTE